MKRAFKIFVVVLTSFVFMNNESMAQAGTSPDVAIFENLKLGFYTGVGTLMQELDPVKNHEFENAIGNTFTVEFSKLVNDKVEIGFSGTQMYLNGSAMDPKGEWFKWMEYEDLEGLRYEPIIYHSQVQSFKIIVQYNFGRFYTPKRGYIPINVFAKFGFGMGFVNSDLDYLDPGSRGDEKIYEIGRGENEILGNSSFISGDIGFEYHLSDRFSFRFQGGISFINKDFVDGVYNREVIKDSPGTYTMLGSSTGGIVYHFNYTTKGQMYNEQYPWFEKKFKNLYSKFYRPKSQKVQLLNYPWHERQRKKNIKSKPKRKKITY